jgi:hypothetical protein
MTGKRVSTELQDLMLKAVNLPCSGARLFLENYIGDDKRAGDGVLSRSDERHMHPRMPIDHGFYFLGVDLKTPNVDDSIPPPGEIVAVAPQFEHVGCVDEAVRVTESQVLGADVTGGHPGGADSKRAVFDLHLDVSARLADDSGRKARKTIVDFERYACLRGGKSVSDLGLRIE